MTISENQKHLEERIEKLEGALVLLGVRLGLSEDDLYELKRFLNM